MPKFKNLAVLAAAVEAGRRYARNNPDKAGKYVDQAAAFVDKQTKGKYHGQIDGVVDKVKGAAGLPKNTPPGPGYGATGGYGTQPAYGRPAPTTPPPTPSPTTSPSAPTTPTPGPTSAVPPVNTPPTDESGRHFPGSTGV